MKLNRAAVLIFLLAGSGWVLLAHTTINHGTTYGSGNVTNVVDLTISTNGTVTVSSNATVTYRAATQIILKPGFTAATGSSFRAHIQADADMDGMDDWWEAANSVSDPELDPDGDHLSNLEEFLLNTNPNAQGSDTSNTTKLKVNRPN